MPYHLLVITLFSSLLLSSCSTHYKTLREQNLYEFLNQSEQLVTYYALPMQLDTQLSVVKMDDTTKKLRSAFNPELENQKIIKKFIQEADVLEDSKIISPEQWRSLSKRVKRKNRYVWFFQLQAESNYSRFPLKLDHFKITYTLSSKVIALNDVLSGEANTPVRSILWIEQCRFHAQNGQFYSVDDWTEQQGRLLQQSIEAMYQTCEKQFNHAFQKLDEKY